MREKQLRLLVLFVLVLSLLLATLLSIKAQADNSSPNSSPGLDEEVKDRIYNIFNISPAEHNKALSNTTIKSAPDITNKNGDGTEQTGNISKTTRGVLFKRNIKIKDNSVLITISITTDKQITFYEVIPNGCEIGYHPDFKIRGNKIYYEIKRTNTPLTWNYELLCNYGEHVIQGYYTGAISKSPILNTTLNRTSMNSNTGKISLEDTKFLIKKISPKPVPVYLWVLLLLASVVFFIVTLISDEL